MIGVQQALMNMRDEEPLNGDDIEELVQYLKEVNGDVDKSDINRMRDIPCDFGTDASEFENYVGRPPRNEEEMEDWIHYIKKGMDGQLDWDTINRCAADNFVIEVGK